jgi:hypothetical protein
LALRGLYAGIGLSLGGGRSGERKIVDLMASLAKKDIDIRGLIARVNSPIRFIPRMVVILPMDTRPRYCRIFVLF